MERERERERENRQIPSESYLKLSRDAQEIPLALASVAISLVSFPFSEQHFLTSLSCMRALSCLRCRWRKPVWHYDGPNQHGECLRSSERRLGSVITKLHSHGEFPRGAAACTFEQYKFRVRDESLGWRHEEEARATMLRMARARGPGHRVKSSFSLGSG